MTYIVPSAADIMSGFNNSKSILRCTEEFLATVIAQTEDGSLTADGGMATYRAVEFTLMGGGPGGDVTFILPEDPEDDDVRDAYISYYESTGTTTIPVPKYIQEQMYNLLAYGPADNE